MLRPYKGIIRGELTAAARNFLWRRCPFFDFYSYSRLHQRPARGLTFEALQVGTKIRSVLIAQIAILFEGFVNDAFEFVGNFAVEADQCGWGHVEDAVENRRRGIALER